MEEAGLSPSEVMREALHRKALELAAVRWADECRQDSLHLEPGAPTAVDLVRRMRDER